MQLSCERLGGGGRCDAENHGQRLTQATKRGDRFRGSPQRPVAAHQAKMKSFDQVVGFESLQIARDRFFPMPCSFVCLGNSFHQSHELGTQPLARFHRPWLFCVGRKKISAVKRHGGSSSG